MQRHRLVQQLEALSNCGNTDHADLLKMTQDGLKSAPDGLRLNQLAKLCSSAENFIELDAEQALYQEFDRNQLQKGLELDLEQILLAQVNKT